MEFTGELMDFDILDNIDQDYAFEIVNEAHNLHETLPNFNKRWSENFKSSLKKQLARPWFVNPKRIGNVARICCHSCQPNMAMVRVFQKGFSPAHCKLLLVTLEDIFPGVELTFDYGPGYLNELKGGCLCERIGCPNTESFGILSRATKKEVSKIDFPSSFFFNFPNWLKSKIFSSNNTMPYDIILSTRGIKGL